MIRVGFCISGPDPRPGEQTAAWKHLVSAKRVHAKRIRFDRFPTSEELRRSYDVVWWHSDVVPSGSDIGLTPKSIAALKSYVERGGSLLLSLTAAASVCDLGFETVRPNVIVSGEWNEESWAKDYPDIRGFAPYQGHPIFAGMTGGPYTWMPSVGRRYSAAVYYDTLPAVGKVVAVERQYIKVIPSRRVITEYFPGRGRVLCVGTYMFFEEHELRVRTHVEALLGTCLTYLTTSRRKIEKTSHWSFDDAPPVEVQRHSRPVTEKRTVWPQSSDALSIRRQLVQGQPGQAFDVGGRRCVFLGHERNGVREVWCHPVRILRNVRVGFTASESPVVWSETLDPEVVVSPEAVTRIFHIGEAVVEEITCSDLHRPAGFLRFRVDARMPVQIVVTAEADLRLMWPLDENATGAVRFAWDDGLRAAVVTTSSGECASFLGSSRQPAQRFVGVCDSLAFDANAFRPEGTSSKVVHIGLAYRWKPEDDAVTLVVAGSGSGEREAESAFRAVVRSTGDVFKEQSEYVRSYFEESAGLTTPDRTFNESLRWAQIGTDRFYLETPGLGSSYVAGFSTVEHGWDGGHKVSGRPGYAWYFGRDSVWTACAALATGDFDKVRGVLQFLGRHQDVTGKILHELTTSGFAHFDAADATPLYVMLFGRYLRASGHLSFARREFARLQKAVEFCQRTDTDGDGLIENTNVGHGWVEGGKLFPVHTEHYLASCWGSALAEAAYAAGLCGHTQLARRWQTASENVQDKIAEEFWDPQNNRFAFAKLKDGSYNKEHTILPAVGMYLGVGSRAQAVPSLVSYASSDFTADWGVRIVGRSNAMFNPTGYHYGSVWPLFTGWVALAEFRHGHPLQGFLHAAGTASAAHHHAAGYVEEVYHGDLFQPAGVCPHQAWSESMVVQPLFEGMLGIDADGIRNRLTVRPWIPPQWQDVRAERLRVGKNLVSFIVQREAMKTVVEFVLEGRTTVDVTFGLRFPLGTYVEEIVSGRKRIAVERTLNAYEEAPEVQFRLASKHTVVVHHRGGLGLVPPLPELVPGKPSSGVRVLAERLTGPQYVVDLEGPGGSEHRIEIIHPGAREVKSSEVEIVEKGEGKSAAVIRFPKGEGYTAKTVRFNV